MTCYDTNLTHLALSGTALMLFLLFFSVTKVFGKLYELLSLVSKTFTHISLRAACFVKTCIIFSFKEQGLCTRKKLQTNGKREEHENAELIRLKNF